MIRHNHYMFSCHAKTSMTKGTPVIASPLTLEPFTDASAQQAGLSHISECSDHAEGGI